jgi:hypothetical protein
MKRGQTLLIATLFLLPIVTAQPLPGLIEDYNEKTNIKQSAKEYGYHPQLYTSVIGSGIQGTDAITFEDEYLLLNNGALALRATTGGALRTTATGLDFRNATSITETPTGLLTNADTLELGTGAITLDATTSNVLLLDGELNLQNNAITNLANPTNPQDAATKNYVDSNAATYTAGDGLDLSSSTFSVDSPSCDGSSEKLLWDGSSFVCGTDRDTNTDASTTNEIQTFAEVLARGTDAGARDATNINTLTAQETRTDEFFVGNQNGNNEYQVYVDDTSSELCYESEGTTTSCNTQTQSCTNTVTASYNDWRCSPGYSSCDDFCSTATITVCNGDDTTCSGGTRAYATGGTEIGRSYGGNTDCGGYEPDHDYDEVECRCTSSDTYVQESETTSTTKNTYCVAGIKQ